MTDKEKQTISELRTLGIGYAKIASTMSLPIGTIKSFCARNKLSAKINGQTCLECGNPMEQSHGQREKKFCSDSCRIKWWNHHTNLMKANSVCVHCGKSFHGRKGRKYCSHACYIAKRFGDKNAS
ncbi:MAG: RNA polymerase subunit sigma-70 [Selenomonadaceae bacterium]|nr:RNA polymerase subunit sigma-70 [Selenomonadaceae bacterium]